MASLPEDMLADASEIRKAAKSLRSKQVTEGLMRRGTAPDSIERNIRDAEVAAEKITAKAIASIAHRKRASLKIVKSPRRGLDADSGQS